jgi:pimeloyl-ACP methyl ester carboxylesterase
MSIASIFGPRRSSDAPVKDDFYQTRHGRIHCRTLGEGIPLFLMHSNGRSAHEFDALAGALAHRFRVVSWDMPGQGDSDRLSRHFTIREYSDLAVDLALEIFGGVKAIMAGASIGAAFALAAGTDHPDSVAGVVPIELPVSRDERWWHDHWTMVETMFSCPDEPAEKLHARFREVTPELAARLRIDRHKAGTWALMDAMWAGREDANATHGRIRNLRVPSLFVNVDKGVAADAATILSTLNRTAKLMVIKNSGHFPHTDDPPGVAAVIGAVFGDDGNKL